MKYCQRIEKETLDTLHQMLAASIRDRPEIATLIGLAVVSEAGTRPHTKPTDNDTTKIYTLSAESLRLLDSLTSTCDRNMILVTEKILKSLKYAVITAHWQDLK